MFSLSGPETESRPSVGAALAALTDSQASNAQRRSALIDLSRALGSASVAGGRSAVDSSKPLVRTLLEAAPRIPVRNLALLRAQNDGLDGEDLADRLVEAAAKSAAAIGAAGGALATAQWFALPTLLAVPVEIVAETLAVAAVEIKLLAELHEVYGVPVTGSAAQRGSALVRAWSERKGVDPRRPVSMTGVLSGTAKSQIRRRLIRRAGTNVSTLGPMLTGAAAGAWLNRRETRKFGAQIRRDLRWRR